MEQLHDLASKYPGVFFEPNEVLLIRHYLKKQSIGENDDPEIIKLINFFDYEPDELPSLCKLPTRDERTWYFFTHQTREKLKMPIFSDNTKGGTWESDGHKINITHDGIIIGSKRQFQFYRGTERKLTDWSMIEYSLAEDDFKGGSDSNDLVICKLLQNEPPPEEVPKLQRESSSNSLAPRDAVSSIPGQSSATAGAEATEDDPHTILRTMTDPLVPWLLSPLRWTSALLDDEPGPGTDATEGDPYRILGTMTDPVVRNVLSPLRQMSDLLDGEPGQGERSPGESSNMTK